MDPNPKACGRTAVNGPRSLALAVLAVSAMAAALFFGGVFDGVFGGGTNGDPVAPIGPGAGRGSDQTAEAREVSAGLTGGSSRDAGDRSESQIPSPPVGGTEEPGDEGDSWDSETRPAFRLRGRVVDANGDPITDARVKAIRPPSDETGGLIEVDPLAFLGSERFEEVVDAEGRFDIEFRAGREFVVLARSDDRPTAQLEGSIPEGVDVVDGLELVLEVGESIFGHVTGIPKEFGAEADLGEIRVVARRSGTGEVSILGFVEMSIGNFDPRVAEASAALGAPDDHGYPFELRGLKLSEDYEVLCVRSWTGTPRRCSAAVTVRSGARGVDLRFDPGTRLIAEILDARSGEPVEGARFAVGQSFGVRILGQKLPQQIARPLDQQSDSDGRLVAEVETDAAQPDRTVQVQCDGYFVESLGTQTLNGQPSLDLGVVRLRKAPTVRVRVVDAVTGDPVADAEVELQEFIDLSEQMNSFRVDTTFEVNRDNQQRTQRWMQSGGPQKRRGESDADGWCELDWNFEAAAELTVQAEGYALWQQVDLVPPVGVETVDFEARLGQGGRVVVTVLDSEGRPVEGASVLRLRGQTMMPSDDNREIRGPSGPDGRVTFTGLAEGEHRFTLSDEEDEGPQLMRMMFSAMTQTEGVVPPGFVAATAVEGRTVEVELREPKRSLVRGFVSLGGEPLEAATVVLLHGPGTGSAEIEAVEEVMQAMQGGLFGKLMGGSEGARGTTSYDGEYELREVPYGSHRVQVDHRDLAMPCILPIEVLAPITDLDLALPSAVLSGQVVDEDGSPIDSIQVSVTTDVGFDQSDLPGADSTFGSMMGMRDRSVRTDRDGRFELRGVRSDRPLKLRVRGSYRVSRSIDLDPLGPSEQRDLGRVDMASAGRVLIRAGETANFGQVRAVWLGEGELEARSLGMIENGSALLRGLRPGNYRIELVEGDGDEKSTEVTVRARETARVEL